jgi:hypothetical protein
MFPDVPRDPIQPSQPLDELQKLREQQAQDRLRAAKLAADKQQEIIRQQAEEQEAQK